MENKKRKLPTYIMIGGVLLIILWFNISYFNHRISSNPQSISEYNLSDDDIAPEAHPAVAGVFYNADTYQSDENSTSEQKTSLQRYCPKIIIVPHEGGRNASKIASGAYGRLEQCRAKIKNVFILAPAHKKSKNLFVPMGSTINTPLGDLPINQQIVSSLLKNKLFKSDISLFNRKNSLKIQLPFLQKTLKSFKIVPILYGMVEGDLIAQTLHNFFDTEGNLFVISADLAVLDNNKDSTLKAHNECNIIGVKTALSLSKEFGLVPQILDITNINRKEIRFDNNKMRGWRYEEVIEQKILYGTELYHNNIKNFVKHHREALIEIIKSSIKSAEKHKHYRINRKKFDNYLFNQGASYVTLLFTDKTVISFGSIYAYKAVSADISDNIYHILGDTAIRKKLKNNKVDLKVELLTTPEEIKFVSYEDLLNKITPQIDGLIIKSGKREGSLLPFYWQNVKSKDDFMVQLKIKAGLSPTYWSDDVKIFKFRTVEIN